MIPTRNGRKYLPHAVRSVLSQQCADCEVVVSVNHSSDDSLAALQAMSDPRLRVVAPTQTLSMSGHYEWLLTQARGEWIALLGDDDAVMPYFFDELRGLIARWPGVLAFTARGADFYWPGCEAVYPDVLTFSAARRERRRRFRGQLLLALGGLTTFMHLPQLYTHGVVHRSLIERIRASSGGRFYHEANPDIYSSAAMAFATRWYVRSETPLFWNGTSPKGTGFSARLLAAGVGSAEAEDRLAEFARLAERDGATYSDDVGWTLYSLLISPALVFSAVRRVPFLPRLWRRRWVAGLVYAAVLNEARRLQQRGDPRASAVAAAGRSQIEKLRLSHTVLRTLGVGLRAIARVIAVWERYRDRDVVSLRSADRARFADIAAASAVVTALVQREPG